MGDYLYGEKLSTTYKQVVAIGGTADRVGIHATTQKALWTDDGAGSKNLFPFTAATDAMQLTTTKRLEFNDAAVYINSSTDSQLNLVADGELDLTAGSFDFNSTGGIAIDGTTVSIDGTGASNFTATGGNLTLSTASSGEIFLTPVTYIQVASGKKLQFADSGEYVSGDGTNLTVGSGADILLTATSDINIPANVGLVFDSNDSEKIESNDTDLTISSGAKINLTATSDVVIPTNVGLHFTDANEKIESDGTNLTINSGADINLTCATGDVNIPADIGLTLGSDNQKIEGDGTDLAISATGNINVTSTVNEANSLYLRANAGVSETIKIHADQGTSVTEGAASVSLLSDAGGVELRSTANLANAVNLTVDGGTTSSMTLFNDQGTSVTEGAASIQLLTDAGGIGIKSSANLASAILLTADGGTSETIKIHSDQGTGAASIELTSDAGGIGINTTATGKSLDINTAILDVDATEASNITMTTNSGSTTSLTIEAANSGGADSDIVIDADGQVHINANDTTNSYAGAGIQIGTDLSGVDVAIGHATSDVRIGDNLLVAGDGTISGDLDVTGALTYGSAAISSQGISGTAPYLTFTNTTHENTAMDDSSDNATGRESKILFKGEKGDGTVHELATIQVGHSNTDNDYDGQIQFFTNSGALSNGALALAMTIAETGYIGIGTATPAYLLDATGTGAQSMRIYSSDNDASLIIASDTDEGQESKLVFASDTTARGSIIYDHHATAATQKMQFLTGDNSDVSMTILGNGNVGIGTASPNQEIGASADTVLTVGDTGTTSGAEGMIELVGYTNDTDDISVGVLAYTSSSNASNHKTLAMVSGESDVAGDDGGGKLHFWTKPDNATATLQRMTIRESGSVGIGTVSPDTKLEVVGSFAANGPSSTFVTMSSGDTSPDVSGGNIFKSHSDGVTVDQFDGGVCGQIITIISGGATVYDVTSSELKGGTTNITTAAGDVTMWACESATVWHLLSWMDLSADLSSGGF